MDEPITGYTDSQSPVSRLDLLFLIRAYNRKEITFEEWLWLSRAWAEEVINHCRPPDDFTLPRKPVTPD